MHIAGLLASLGFPPMDENLHDNVNIEKATHAHLACMSTIVRKEKHDAYHVVRYLSSNLLKNWVDLLGP